MRYNDQLLGLLLENASTLIERAEDDFRESPVQSGAPYMGPIATDGAGVIQRLRLIDLVPQDVWDRLFNATSGAAA